MRFVKELTRPCDRQGTCTPGFAHVPGVAPVTQAEPWLDRCYDAACMVFSFITRRHSNFVMTCHSVRSGYNLVRMKFETLLGILICFSSEEDWIDYRLENDPRFLARIAQARASYQAGLGVRIEDVSFDEESLTDLPKVG